MKASLLCLAVLLPLCAHAAGSNWKIISNGADESQLSTDLARLKCNEDVCTASEKTSYLRPLPNGASSVEDDVEYDCRKALTRTLGETLFDAEGQTLKQSRGASPWLPIGLGTVGFESMRFACREGQEVAATPRPPSEASEASTSPPAKPPLEAPRPSPAVVQVVSSPTEQGARRVLREFIRTHPEAARLSGGVERAVSHGRVTYLAVVAGFPSRQAAAIFCSRIRQKGGDCVARLAGASSEVDGSSAH